MKRLLVVVLAVLCLGVFMSHTTFAQTTNAFDGICHPARDPQPTGEVDANGNPILSPALTDTTKSAVCTDNNGNPNDGSEDPITGANGVLTKAVSLIALLTGIASVLLIIIGGIKYVTSAGEPSKVSSAKDTILYAVIGLVISVVARGIILFVVNRLK